MAGVRPPATRRDPSHHLVAGRQPLHRRLGRQHFNWTYYVFYGGDIREQALGWLLDQLQDIAQIPATDEDGDRVQGFFLASHEIDGMNEWQVRDGQVLISPADSRHEYLDTQPTHSESSDI
jgi:hypothetical protein